MAHKLAGCGKVDLGLEDVEVLRDDTAFGRGIEEDRVVSVSSYTRNEGSEIR
jgi:hypothetical protein